MITTTQTTDSRAGLVSPRNLGLLLLAIGVLVNPWILGKIFAPDGSLVDSVLFGPQTNNVSMGRSTDGGPNIVFFTTPSPRGSNSSAPAAPELTDITVVGANVFLTYSATPGVRYQVQFKDNLNVATWNPLGAPALAAASSVTVTDNLGASPQRFYQVVVVP